MAEQKMDDFLALQVMTKTEAKFRIGDKEFIMVPLVPRKLRELLNLLAGLSTVNFTETDNLITFLSKKIVEVFPLLFRDEITQEFADDNMSIPLLREIYTVFIKLNALEDILPFFQTAIRVQGTKTEQPKQN